MSFKQKSKTATTLSVLFATALIAGAVSAGAYTGTVTQGSQNIQKDTQNTTKEEEKKWSGNIATTYDDNQQINIPIDIGHVKNGEFIWLGKYQLEKGDKVYYDVSAKKGNRLIVGFAKPKQKKPSTVYNTISNLRNIDGKLEIKSGAMVWKLQPGKYRLFIRTKGGTLTNVNGKVTIVKANAD